MLGRDIIAKIISENGLDKDYRFETGQQYQEQVKEPENLSEISDVSFEYGRVVLNVRNPLAARKFSLKDNIEKYEFDGGTMFFYRNRKGPSSYSYSCGRGCRTMVGTSDSDCIASVKKQMAEQIFEKKIACPKAILYDLPVQPRMVSEYTWCK